MAADVSPVSLITKVSSPILPAGGFCADPGFLSAPHAFVSGQIVMDLDPKVFGNAVLADAFSALAIKSESRTSRAFM